MPIVSHFDLARGLVEAGVLTVGQAPDRRRSVEGARAVAQAWRAVAQAWRSRAGGRWRAGGCELEGAGGGIEIAGARRGRGSVYS
jgi:hypothetical protein